MSNKNCFKVLVGGIYQETNSFSKVKVTYDDFSRYHSRQLIDELPACGIFEAAGMKVVPAAYARILPSAPPCRQEFEYFLEDFFSSCGSDTNVDAIFLNLHGAMYIPEIGSGEVVLLRRLREKYGWNIPIFAAFDFHGNMFPELARLLNYATAYKTAPHVDEEETQLRAAKALVEVLKTGRVPAVRCWQVPIALPGEMVLTSLPVSQKILGRLSDVARAGKALEAAWFCGFVWSDTKDRQMSIAVTATDFNKELNEEIDRIARELWSCRQDFKLGVPAYEPKEAVRQALCEALKGPGVFLSDSGDNVTAGASGDNSLMAKLLAGQMEADAKLKRLKALTAGIVDLAAVRQCFCHKPGDEFFLHFGGTFDEGSVHGHAKVVLISTGTLLDGKKHREIGYAHIRWGAEEILLTQQRFAFTCPQVFLAAGIDLCQYDLVCVKLGYLYPELEPLARISMLALSPGNAPLDISLIPYGQHTRRL